MRSDCRGEKIKHVGWWCFFFVFFGWCGTRLGKTYAKDAGTLEPTPGSMVTGVDGARVWPDNHDNRCSRATYSTCMHRNAQRERERERRRSSASVRLRAPQGEKQDLLGDVCDGVLC